MASGSPQGGISERGRYLIGNLHELSENTYFQLENKQMAGMLIKNDSITCFAKYIMANYIDKDILCQAYLHVDIDDRLDQCELEALKKQFAEFLKTRGTFFIHSDIEVEVEFKEGSLKAYLTIAGAMYIAIAQYGGFRSGIDYMYSDSKRLSESIVAEGLFQTKSKHEDIRRTESRTGIIGKLKDLINEMRVIESSIGHSSVPVITQRIEDLTKHTEVLIENIRSKGDQREIEHEIFDTANALPKKPPYPKNKKPERNELVAYQEARRKLLAMGREREVHQDV